VGRKEQQKDWHWYDYLADYCEYRCRRWGLWWGQEYYFQTNHHYAAYFKDIERAIPHKNLKEKTGMSFDDVDYVTKRGTYVRWAFVIESLSGRIGNLLEEELIEMLGKSTSNIYVINVKKEYFNWQDVARAVIKYGEYISQHGAYHLDGHDVGYVYKNYTSQLMISRKEKTGHFLMIDTAEKRTRQKHFRQQVKNHYLLTHQIAQMVEHEPSWFNGKN